MAYPLTFRVDPEGRAHYRSPLHAHRGPGSHIWTQGPGPWAPQTKWLDTFLADHPTIHALCGVVLREEGRWSQLSSVTAELLLHHPDEEDDVCAGCLRVLVAHPIRCSAGRACTGDILCRG